MTVDRMRAIAERLGIRFRVRGGKLQVRDTEDEAKIRQELAGRDKPKADRWAASDAALETWTPIDESNYQRFDIWPSEWLNRR